LALNGRGFVGSRFNIKGESEVSRTRRLAGILVVFVLLVAVTGTMAASRVFTIQGKILDPEGQPVAGAPLQISPLTPDQGWDTLNVFYKIPSYDFHRTTTNQNGDFVMAGIIDYPENYTKYYVVSAVDGFNGLHIRQIVNLRSTTDVITLNAKAEYATLLSVSLRGSDGKPYNGRRGIYVQSGRRLGDARFGASFIRDAEFRDGVYQYWMVVKPDRYARVAVLNAPAVDVKKSLAAKGLKAGDSLDPLSLVAKDLKGKALDREISLTPRGEASVDFVLP
jgi:hypothetical protein